MPRKLIAMMIAFYAIAFAFGALTAVRWPSIMMVVSWLVHDELAAGVAQVDWRELGITHGGPYLIAAICFYAAALQVSARRRGSILWYICGLAFGFPVFYLVTFEPGWWQDPSIPEGGVAGLGAVGVLLLIAVWELRYRSPRELAEEDGVPLPAEAAPAPVQVVYVREEDGPVVVRAPAARPAFVPAAVARQRASFAHHGRRMAERRQRVLAARGQG
ncbi:MAG: hypothetical protein KDA53_16290 [Hyphomonas sp.]|nr:hypothetical protein [Hyphomonas sp.]